MAADEEAVTHEGEEQRAECSPEIGQFTEHLEKMPLNNIHNFERSFHACSHVWSEDCLTSLFAEPGSDVEEDSPGVDSKNQTGIEDVACRDSGPGCFFTLVLDGLSSSDAWCERLCEFIILD